MPTRTGTWRRRWEPHRKKPSRIIPISKQKELIEERTGAKVKQYGQMFKLNPEVSDIAEGFGTNLKGVTLLVLGAIEAGGSGCACPESVLIRALVSDLVLHRKDALVMDMEAGIEHLGRATARGVDTLLVMVEPSQRAIDSAHRWRGWAPRSACATSGSWPTKLPAPPTSNISARRCPDGKLWELSPGRRRSARLNGRASGARPAGRGAAGLLREHPAETRLNAKTAAQRSHRGVQQLNKAT